MFETRDPGKAGKKRKKYAPVPPPSQPRRRPPRPRYVVVVQGRDDPGVRLQRLGALELEGRREQAVLRGERVGLQVNGADLCRAGG